MGWGTVAKPGRKRAPCWEVRAFVGTGTGTGLGLGSDVSNIAIGVRWRGWVPLGGHNPTKRREGRVGELADGQVPVLFGHGGEINGREGKREWGGRKI